MTLAKKAKSFLMATIMGMTVMTTLPLSNASAAEVYQSSTTAAAEGQTSFTKAWSKVVDMDFNVSGVLISPSSVTLTIGYDTWWVKEDYVTKCFAPTGWDHFARVMNSNGDYEDTKVLKGGYNTGKADVKHTGSTVTYYAFIEA